MTVGSLFATVGTAANAVTSVLDTTVRSVSMLDRYVRDAQERQDARSTVDMDSFTEQLRDEKSMEEAMRKKQVLDFTSQSEINQQLYAAAYDRIGRLLDSRKKAAPSA
jgi:hypothetical protein